MNAPLLVAVVFATAIGTVSASSYTRTLAVDGVDVLCEGKTCSGYGTCSLGQCTCFKGWKASSGGDDCEAEDNCVVDRATFGDECTGNGACSESNLNYPAIKAPNGRPQASCSCEHSSIAGERCGCTRSPNEAPTRFEGSLVGYGNSMYVARDGKLVRVRVGGSDRICWVDAMYAPEANLTTDEFKQFDLATQNEVFVPECFARAKKSNGDWIVCQIGSDNPECTNVDVPFRLVQASQASSAMFRVNASGDPSDITFSEPVVCDGAATTDCGDTAFSAYQNELFIEYLEAPGQAARIELTTASRRRRGLGAQGMPSVSGLIYGETVGLTCGSEAYEKMADEILKMRKTALGGKLAFQVSWPLGGPDYAADPTNNADEELALLWSKWSAFMNVAKDEVIFTGNDQFEVDGGENATFGSDPEDHARSDTTPTARLFASPIHVRRENTAAPTQAPTVPPTPESQGKHPYASCRGGFPIESTNTHCNAIHNQHPIDNLRCSCKVNANEPKACWTYQDLTVAATIRSNYPCCFDAYSVCHVPTS